MEKPPKESKDLIANLFRRLMSRRQPGRGEEQTGVSGTENSDPTLQARIEQVKKLPWPLLVRNLLFALRYEARDRDPKKNRSWLLSVRAIDENDREYFRTTNTAQNIESILARADSEQIVTICTAAGVPELSQKYDEILRLVQHEVARGKAPWEVLILEEKSPETSSITDTLPEIEIVRPAQERSALVTVIAEVILDKERTIVDPLGDEARWRDLLSGAKKASRENLFRYWSLLARRAPDSLSKEAVLGIIQKYSPRTK